MLPYLNDYQKEGELTVPGLRDAVAVKRDEKGMAYIYAQNLPDALMAQGFVTAQDRLFQMHLIRLLTQGRMSEFCAGLDQELVDNLNVLVFLDGVLELPLHRLKAVDSTCD